MTKRLILFFFICLPVLASAQKKDKTAMKAAASINAADMKKHLYIIASKEMEGGIPLHRAWKKPPIISKNISNLSV